jgi:hypothetical protein
MNKSKWILGGGILIGIISLFTFAILTIFSTANSDIFKSIFLGDLFAYINFLAGVLFTGWGIRKPNKQFLISIYGGILLRLSLLLVLLVITLIFLEINKISFIFSNLFFYFFYVIAEIIYLNHRER